jgi:cytochrome d ubiquinol oxidase subunit I
VIGQTLAMEGMFAFFLESSFLGLFLFGEKRLGRAGHFLAALMVFIGSWLSGYFIIATNAWMQHPVGHSVAPDGAVHLDDFWALLFNDWAFWQYFHNMGGAVVTGSFLMAAVGAFYVLGRKDVEYGKMFLRVGVIVACAASLWQLVRSLRLRPARGRVVGEALEIGSGPLAFVILLVLPCCFLTLRFAREGLGRVKVICDFTVLHDVDL